MSKFSIETETIKHSAGLLGEAAGSLGSYASAISGVQSALTFSPSIQSGIGDSLNILSQRVVKQSGNLRLLGDGLRDSNKAYRTAEENIVHNYIGDESLLDMLMHNLPKYLLAGTGFPFISGLMMLDDMADWWNWSGKTGGGELTKKHNAEVDLLDRFKKDKDKGEKENWFNKIDDLNDKHKKGLLNERDENGKTKLDENGKPIKTDSKKGYFEKGEDGKIHAVRLDEDDRDAKKEFDDRFKGPIDADVKIAGAEVAAAGALLPLAGENGKLLGDKDGTHASANAEALAYEAKAGAYAGPGSVGVYAGASVTAFSAEVEAQLGSDDLGAYVKGSVDAGKAEAGVDATFGLYDKDGKFNPSAHAGASAEAIAVEAKATVGGKVLGTDVSVTGGVNVGIGAHADVGFQDGKVSFDIGASLGVGFSLSGEIDVSGTINAVADSAKSAVDWLGGIFT